MVFSFGRSIVKIGSRGVCEFELNFGFQIRNLDVGSTWLLFAMDHDAFLTLVTLDYSPYSFSKVYLLYFSITVI